ncbi:MAG: hypothetical protein QW706_09710 [Candidatus Nezhaarchaeales archaeon]
MRRLLGNAEVKIYNHATSELLKLPELVSEDFEFIVVGFLANNLVDNRFRNASIKLYGSDGKAFQNKVKSYDYIEYPPMKVIATRKHVVLTTADIVLKNYEEISFVGERRTCFDTAIQKYVSGLRRRKRLRYVML